MEHQLPSDSAKLTLINGGRLPLKPRQPSSASLEAVRQRLPSVLQTTLVLEEVLSLFRQEIGQVLPFDSFHYDNTAVHCQLEFDKACHHRCHYKLELNGQYLGDLTLTRRQRFTDADISSLESLLCQLVYPLRNSLLYKQALSSALSDELTGLGNRLAYETSLKREIELARRHDQPLSLIVIDIDHFKMINDTHGHSNGDRALKALAETIMLTMRSSDIAFRFGGEEFVLLLNNTTASDAGLVAERLRHSASLIYCGEERHRFNFTISLGIAELQQDEQSYHLFERADVALYQAKQTGRNALVYASSQLF